MPHSALTRKRRTPNFLTTMAESGDSRRPRLGEDGKANAELRRRRQAEALRENLARRKAQDRGRKTTPDAEGRKQS